MAEAKQSAVYTPRLKALYNETYLKELQAELNLDNVNQVPSLEKIVVKIRKGMGSPIGVMVTLRGVRMYEFLDRLVNVSLPRVRDFHGVGSKFDKSGNYNLGITDQSIFPELTFEETQLVHGLQVTFVIKNGSKENSRALLEKFGLPFEKEDK